jgi:hypothetical protein
MGDRRTGEWVQGDAQERRARLARQAPLIDRVARETPRRRKRTTKSDALEEAGVLLKRVVAILFAVSIVAAFAGPAIAVNSPAPTQPDATTTAAATPTGRTPDAAPKPGQKAALHKPKKKKSSFSRKFHDQIEKFRPKVQDLFDSLKKKPAEP